MAIAARPGRRLRAVALLGLAAGLGSALFANAAGTWAGGHGSRLLALVALPFFYRVVWAPLLDRYALSSGSRRRGWVVAAQLALTVLIAAVALAVASVRAGALAWVLGPLAMAAALAAATQETAVDAYRIEVLAPREVGPGAGLYVIGYQLGALLATSAAAGLAAKVGWPAALAAAALAMLAMARSTLSAPVPAEESAPAASLDEAVVMPFHGLVARESPAEALAFTALYLVPNALGFAALGSLLGGRGVPLEVARPWRLVAGLAGALLGGYAIPWVGTYAALWAAGLAHALVQLGWWGIATGGRPPEYALALLALDGFVAGAGLAALQAYVLELCEPRRAATQAAALTTLAGLSRFAAVPVGVLLPALGWPLYFLMCAVMAIPPLLLLTRLRWPAPRGVVPALR